IVVSCFVFFFFQAEDGIRDFHVTGVQTCALPIWAAPPRPAPAAVRPRRTAEARLLRPRTRPPPPPGRRRKARPGRPPARATGCRSEERRVGKEWRARWEPRRRKKKERREADSRTQ